MTENKTILGSFFKAIGYLDPNKNIVVSVSGGSDSDIILDFVYQCGFLDKVKLVWFDTGMEYDATKRHLDYLEARYNCHIERIKAYKPIPSCVKQYGVPFISKFISEQIERLQRHNFQWEDEPVDVLLERYPGCKCSIQWWCNVHSFNQWNISYKKYLKEFLIENPPTFSISSKCCVYSKKKTAKRYYKENATDVCITGMRMAEGGVRQGAYKSCYESYSSNQPDSYRPIWWYTQQDKEEYNRAYAIKNSDCYTKYGFRRTGCVCCPFGLQLEHELKVLERYEPKLYNVAWQVFGQSYEYTRKYYEFRRSKEAEDRRIIRKTASLDRFLEVME